MAANKVFWWDAPKGFKAVKSSNIGCIDCYMWKNSIPCPENHICISMKRKDRQAVIFIKRENHVQ